MAKDIQRDINIYNDWLAGVRPKELIAKYNLPRPSAVNEIRIRIKKYFEKQQKMADKAKNAKEVNASVANSNKINNIIDSDTQFAQSNSYFDFITAIKESLEKQGLEEENIKQIDKDIAKIREYLSFCFEKYKENPKENPLPERFDDITSYYNALVKDKATALKAEECALKKTNTLVSCQQKMVHIGLLQQASGNNIMAKKEINPLIIDAVNDMISRDCNEC